MSVTSAAQRHPHVAALLIGSVAGLAAILLDLVIGSRQISWYTLALGRPLC